MNSSILLPVALSQEHRPRSFRLDISGFVSPKIDFVVDAARCGAASLLGRLHDTAFVPRLTCAPSLALGLSPITSSYGVPTVTVPYSSPIFKDASTTSAPPDIRSNLQRFGLLKQPVHFLPSSLGLSLHPARADTQTKNAMKTSDEFFRGGIAAIINVIATFPIHKIMFRQQVSGLTLGAAVREILGEGTKTLWRGVIPPLIQRASGVALMFSTYKTYADALAEVGTSATLASALAGAASGITESLLTPLERVQTILQHKTFNETVRGTRHCIALMAPHGMKEFYRGFSAVFLRCVSTNALFFSLRGNVKQHVLGASAAIMVPVDSPAANIGKQSSGMAAKTARSYSSPLHMHVDTEMEDDYEYMGYFWARAEAGPVPTQHPRSLEVFADFASGGLLGGCIGLLFYPLSVVKSIMQLKIGGHYATITETMQSVYRRKGFSGLMAGAGTNFSRSMLSWGLMNACYELMSPNGLGYPSEWWAMLEHHGDKMPEQMMAPSRTEDLELDQYEQFRREQDRRMLRGKWKNAMRIAQSQFW